MVAQGELKTLNLGKNSLFDEKTDTYTGPAFEIKHQYWAKWQGANGTGDNGSVGSQLYVTNTAEVPIRVTLSIDLDDTGDAWDAVFIRGTEQFTENKIDLGVIQPKDTVHTTYWWELVNKAGEPYAETFEVTFKVSPKVTIDYKQFKPFRDSKATVITVE